MKTYAGIFKWSADAGFSVWGSALLATCHAPALTALGVGTSTGIFDNLGGAAYRTFAVPEPQLREAAEAALKTMGITHESTEKIESGELIKARGANRLIEIERASVTIRTTRTGATAKQSPLFHDGAAAAEIIMQTEELL